jgi:hypothetical protein
MKHLLFIVAIFCTLFLMGCTRNEGTLDIAGNVLDEYTKEGIPNRSVIIQGLISSDYELIPTVDLGRFYTDSCGHFTYTLEKTKNVYWYNFIFAGDSTYAYSTHTEHIAELEFNSKFLSYSLDKFTDFSIRVERHSKTAPSDTLFLTWKTNGSDGRIYPYKVINYGIAPDFEFRWTGANVKSLIEAKTFANKNTIVYLHIFSERGVQEMSDTIYCIRDVKNYFTFKY